MTLRMLAYLLRDYIDDLKFPNDYEFVTVSDTSRKGETKLQLVPSRNGGHLHQYVIYVATSDAYKRNYQIIIKEWPASICGKTERPSTMVPTGEKN